MMHDDDRRYMKFYELCTKHPRFWWRQLSDNQGYEWFSGRPKDHHDYCEIEIWFDEEDALWRYSIYKVYADTKSGIYEEWDGI